MNGFKLCNFYGKRCLDNFKVKLGIIAFFAGAAASAVGAPTDQQSPSWLEHWDLARVLFAAMFGLIAWFLIRTLHKIDNNQSELFRRLLEVEKAHAELKGRCDAVMCSGSEE